MRGQFWTVFLSGGVSASLGARWSVVSNHAAALTISSTTGSPTITQEAQMSISFLPSSVPRPSTCPCSSPNGTVKFPSHLSEPDWDSFPTTYPSQNSTGSNPEPHALADPSSSLLVLTVQDKVLREYDAYSTLSCFMDGSTLNCKGPWLYGNDWNNKSLPRRLYDSTAVNPSYWCSADTTYLQDSAHNRNFYGFTAKNVTDSLEGIAHSASLYAAGLCALNQTCAQTYNNDTDQMYSDFRFYINATFFEHMKAALPQNNTKIFCPASISGKASLFAYSTTFFNGGKEYFGVHDAVLLPGVANSLNGTMQEARKELGLQLANNARRAEGVFLNMIFYTYGTSRRLKKRWDEEAEVYPGCKRRDWVRNGECAGVIPPRDYDLAGEVLPMKYRDEMEVYGSSSHNSPRTGKDLMVRAPSCTSKINAINNKIREFGAAKGLIDYAEGSIATIGLLVSVMESVEAAGTAAALAAISPALAPSLAVLAGIIGGAGMVALAALAACETFNTCDGFPPALIAATRQYFGKLQLGAVGVTVVKTMRNIDLAALGGLLTPALFAGGAYVDTILDAAEESYQNALACCQSNCDSASCTQAGLGCLLSWGQFFGGVKVKCAAS